MDLIVILLIILTWHFVGRDFVQRQKDYIERKIEERRNNIEEP